MFRVIEKGGERRAVYSRGDLEYMQARGWRAVSLAPVAPVAERVEPEPRLKRRYTKRAKA
jgi:hypothetical protein